MRVTIRKKGSDNYEKRNSGGKMGDYVILCESNKKTMQDVVNAMIEEGIYFPCGGVTRDSVNGCFFQSMIKKELLEDIIKNGQLGPA